MNIYHTSGSIGEKSHSLQFTNCVQWRIGHEIQLHYCYDQNYSIHKDPNSLFIIKAYPKDQNPRRHLRDLLTKNQRI